MRGIWTSFSVTSLSSTSLDSLRLAPSECRVVHLVLVDVDQFWYRASVKMIQSMDRVEIQFIDYGTKAANQLYNCLKSLFTSHLRP